VKSCNKCDKKFIPKVTYQIYCSEFCREEATKEKIAQRYLITRRQKRIGKKRLCRGDCGLKLSIYNVDGFCSNCNINKKIVDKTLREIKKFFDHE
jgi:hypothetical protein